MRDGTVECQFTQFDSTRAAGFTEGLRVAQYAEQYGTFIVPHQSPEIHGHLVVALPKVGYCVETHGSEKRDPLRHQVYANHIEMRDGYIEIGDKPGFGVEIDWKAVERHTVS
jgi:D-galactarolactone cycloisomerase